MTRHFRVAMAVLAVIAGFPALSLGGNASTSPEVTATYQDVKETLGIVPGFIRAFPEEGVVGAWEDMKGVQMNPSGALPGKIKELIGIGISAQIPCRYCVYFHTEAAKLNGATDREIREALVIAADVRRWSTVLNGLQMDESRFRKDTDKMLEIARERMEKKDAKASEPVAVTDAQSAYKDMERTLGLVPQFLRLYPEEGVAGVWKLMKGTLMNPASPISAKYRELIGLGVAAQVPCKYCTYYHTEASKLDGATDREIREAVAMAASTRHWSTYLNGLQIDEQAFRREVAQIMAYLKRKPGTESVVKRAKQPARSQQSE